MRDRISAHATLGSPANGWAYGSAIASVSNISLEVETVNCPASVPTDRWRGEFYNNINLSGIPTTVRDDGAGFLNFNFGDNPPAGTCGVPADNFSARWTRMIDFPRGVYRFTVTADDGVRLYVDGQVKIDAWVLQGPTTYTADVFLTAGNHEIKLEYFESTLGALISLNWTTLVNCIANVPTDRWRGEYYNGATLSGDLAMARDDGNGFLNFNWGNGSPGSVCGQVVDNFSARWTRTVNFTTAGVYRFYAAVDNGVRLYVDGQNIIDQWGNQPPNTYTADVDLNAGPHEVKLEFVEYEGGASVSLSWAIWTARDLNMALIDPINGKGSPGEDLLSRNYNWSLPLLSLPGRAGLDLSLALSLNSLIYTRAGSVMHFDPDQGYPARGFRLGFPEIRNAFINTEANAQSYLLSMPSGRRVEFRQINTNVYEAVDSSYMLLTHNPLNSVFVLYTTDGTQCRFVDVTGLGNYKCVQIKDRQGNYITIDYGGTTEIRTVTETLGRVINFNYDGSNHLNSITQNWGGQTHTWATFAYGTQTIQTNFPGLTLNGTANGAQESVLLRVGLADGTVYSFEYNTYAQVKTIRRYAPNNSNPVNFPGDYLQLAYTTYGLPDNANDSQADCPRITSRTDWAYDWNPGVTSTYAADPGRAWGQVTFPDSTIYKEFFATAGWQRGLTTQTENWSGGVRKKWTTLQWTQDNTGVAYRLNPRVTETIINDEANNHRRTRVDYTNFGLPSDVYEYDADTTTVLRLTHTDYNLSAVYTSRRIIGLPSASYLYDGNNTLFSKVTYEYDLNPNPNPYLQHPGPTAQHDTANYGSSFVQGRGNLNRKLRWDVTDPDNASKYETGYNTSGSVIFTRDPLNHETTVSYADSFSDEQNRNTYAYPTRMTDPDTFSSTVQYNYDFGAVTQTKDPKETAVTHTYDAAGRVERITNIVNGAYTRYVYGPNQLYVKSYTTVNDLSSEFYQITVFDGRGRTRGVASGHPGSVGGYKAQVYEYDIMGRRVRQTNPTEINNPTESPVNWAPAGDDAAAGWVWSSQAYDWQGLPTVTTNQDGTTKEISYGGCGCAGGDVVTITDEGTTITDASGQPQFKRRQRKIFHDVLGREVKTQVLNWENGSPYSTTINTYDVRDQIVKIREFQDAGPVPDDGVSCPIGVCQKTERVYDGHGRLSQSKLPIESGFTTYTYRPDDTVETVLDPRGVTALRSYNNRHLLTGVSYSGGGGSGIKPSNPVTYEYNELGQRTKMTDGLGHMDYNYNTLGQMVSETRVFNNLSSYNPDNFKSHMGLITTYTFSYEYNVTGQLKKITDPWQGSTTYQRDEAGQVISVTGEGYGNFDLYNNTTITQLISGVKYRAWGAVKEFNTGTVASLSGHSYQYNSRLQVTNLSQGGRATTQTYYNDGLVKDVTDHFRPAFSRYSEYDHVGRLKLSKAGNDPDWTKNPFFFTYEYNVFGNTTRRAGQTGPPAIPAHHWSELLPDFTATWTNNRDDLLSQLGFYNALGQFGKESDHNQAGLLARFDRPPTPPGILNLMDRYYYDGDGERGYMNQYYHLDPHTPPPDDPTGTLNSTNQYYLRSTPLGGLIIAEFSLLRDAQNKMWQSYGTRIYFNGEDIAGNGFGYVDPGPFWGGNTARTLMWTYRNPFTGSVYSHRYKIYAEGAPPIIDTSEDNTTDAVGASVAASDPGLGSPPPVENLELDPAAISGDIHDYRHSCRVDGAITPCGEVLHRINNNPGMFTITRINHSRFFIFPQFYGAPDFKGVAPRLTDVLRWQGGRAQNPYIQRLRKALENLPANCQEALGGKSNYMALLDRLVNGDNYNIMASTDPKPPLNKGGRYPGQTTNGNKKITTVLGKDYFEPSVDEKSFYRISSRDNMFDMDGYQDQILIHEFTHVIYRLNRGIDPPWKESHNPIWKDLKDRGFDVPDAYEKDKAFDPDFKPTPDETAARSILRFFIKGCPKAAKK